MKSVMKSLVLAVFAVVWFTSAPAIAERAAAYGMRGSDMVDAFKNLHDFCLSSRGVVSETEVLSNIRDVRFEPFDERQTYVYGVCIYVPRSEPK